MSQAYESLGTKRLPDLNSGDILGYCEGQYCTYHGKRQFASKCYPRGQNVTTWVETLVEKLLFVGNRAVGVQVIRSGEDGTSESATVTARKEVIVSSGVQGSAKLLLLRSVSSHSLVRSESNTFVAASVQPMSSGSTISIKQLISQLEITIPTTHFSTHTGSSVTAGFR